MAYESEEDKAAIAAMMSQGWGQPGAGATPQDTGLLSGMTPQQAAMISGKPAPVPGQPLVGPGSVDANPPPMQMPQTTISGPSPGGPAPIPMGPVTHLGQPPGAPSHIGGPQPYRNVSTAPYEPESAANQQAKTPDMSKVVAAGPPPGAAPAGAAAMQSPGGAAPPPQQYAPARTSPARFQETMAPDQRKLLEEGRQNELEGVRNTALGDSNSMTQQADAMKAAREELQKPDPQQAELDRQKQATLTHYENLRKDLEKGPDKVDPNHYFASKSVPQQIMIHVGMALGAAGAVFGHTENFAAKFIENRVNEDVAAQTANIENRRDGLRDAKGLLADNWRMFGDKEKAIAATKQQQYQFATMTIDEMAKRNGSATALANGQRLQGVLQQKAAEEDATHNRYVPAQTTGAAGGPLTAMQQAEIDLKKSQAEKNRGETAHLGDKKDTHVAGEVKQEEQDAAKKNIIRNVTRLEALNKEAGYAGLLSPEKRAEAESLRTQIGLDYNPSNGIQRTGGNVEQNHLRDSVVPSFNHPGSPAARQVMLDALKNRIQQAPEEGAPGPQQFNVRSFKKVGQ